MIDPAQLQAWLDALVEARMSGVRSITVAGRTIEYRSDRELVAAIAAAQRELGQCSVTDIRLSTSKGLGGCGDVRRWF